MRKSKQTRKLIFAVSVAIMFTGTVVQLTWKKLSQDRTLFGQEEQYRKYKGATLDEVEGIAKYDRPDLAVIQNFEMTKDPSSDVVPVSRALTVFKQIKSQPRLKAASAVNWIERGPNNVGGRTRALMFDPNDATGKKVWAGGVAGGLWYNNNITSGSSVWKNIDDFWANLAISSIAYDPNDTKVFYVGTGEGFYNADAVRGAGIWKTTDGGTTWSQLGSTDKEDFYYVQKVAVTSKGTVLAATRNGLFRSTDGGATWSKLYSGRFADIEVASNNTIYASKGVFSTGEVRKSTNDGASWTDVTPETNGERIELAVSPSDPNTVYAIASNSRVIRWFKKTTNGGSSWSNVTIPRYKTQSCSNSSDDFTRGQAWYDLILAVHPNNSNIVIVGGIDLYKSTNGGSSWGLISYWTGRCDAYVHADQHAIQFSPVDNNEAIFGNDGGVFYSSNVGNASNPSFEARNNGYNVTQFYAADQENTSGSNYMLAGAQDNGSHKFTASGINSTDEVTGGDGAFCHIDQKNGNYQVTSYVYNNYYRSTNGGGSFGTILRDSDRGRFINPSEYDDNAKILYAAANENQYYRISRMTGSPSANVISAGLAGFRASAFKASPYTNNRIFIGTGTNRGEGGSKIFRVDNANGTPSVTEIGTGSLPGNAYISSIDIGSNDDQIIITYSNYGIKSVWETRNGGSSWSNREGNLPDIPVRWVLYNPKNRNEVIVATELGVWSTENINVTSPKWVVTNTGLANVRCDMLQYRDSDGTVLVATHGRGVYTGKPFTGGSSSDTEAPTIPTNLSSSNITSVGFDISWTASTDNVGVTGYNVYINGTLSGTPTTTDYSFSGLTPSTDYTVEVEAKDAAGNISDAASISVTTSSGGGSCGTVISSFPYNQGFENGIGNWAQDNSDDLDWTVDANGTPSSSTGPSSAVEGTYYLYIESSGNGDGYPNKNAIVATPCFDVTALTNPELTFSYHMYGSSMGELVVETSTDGGQTWTEAWSLSGNQGNQWTEVKLDLPSSATVKVRFNGTTSTSYRSDMAIDAVTVAGRVAGPQCPTIEFTSVQPYSSQDVDGDYSVQEGNNTLFLENNTWKYISYNYTVTSNTVIEFDFRSTAEGEIHGIGFDTDNTIDANATFKVHGTQNWGTTNYDNYSGSDWVHYSIPVGSFYTGSFDRVFFVNDNDGSGVNNSYFRNVIVHEGDCGSTIPEYLSDVIVSEITPIVKEEGEFSVMLYPNPVVDKLYLSHGYNSGSYSLYSVSGQLYYTGKLNEPGEVEINTGDLNSGIYILRVESSEGNWVKKIRKK